MTVSHLRSSKLQAPMHWRLSMMFCKVYGAKRPCEDFCNALITTLYNNKGSKSNCGNYRGISLLSIAGTIFTRILPNRLIMETERGLPVWLQTRVQHPGHDFVIRQVQEKCIEQSKALFSVLINLTKVFNTVNREALWMVLERYGCPKKFVRLIQLPHDGMTGQLSSLHQ